MQKKQQKAAFVIETLDLQKRKQHFQNPSPKSAHLKGVTCRVAKRQQKGRMRWHKRAGYVLPFCKNTGCVGTTQKKRQESITVANSLCKHRSGKSGAVACCDSIPPSKQNYPTLLSKTYTTALVSDCEVSKQIQTFPLLHNAFENSSCRYFFPRKTSGKNVSFFNAETCLMLKGATLPSVASLALTPLFAWKVDPKTSEAQVSKWCIDG